MAEHAEHPPAAGRREQAALVVDDDAGIVADAERLNRGGEACLVRQHVRQRRGGVGDPLDIEEGGAGQVGCLEQGGRVLRFVGEVERRVEKDQRRIIEYRGESLC